MIGAHDASNGEEKLLALTVLTVDKRERTREFWIACPLDGWIYEGRASLCQRTSRLIQ